MNPPHPKAATNIFLLFALFHVIPCIVLAEACFQAEREVLCDVKG